MANKYGMCDDDIGYVGVSEYSGEQWAIVAAMLAAKLSSRGPQKTTVTSIFPIRKNKTPLDLNAIACILSK